MPLLIAVISHFSVNYMKHLPDYFPGYEKVLTILLPPYFYFGYS